MLTRCISTWIICLFLLTHSFRLFNCLFPIDAILVEVVYQMKHSIDVKLFIFTSVYISFSFISITNNISLLCTFLYFHSYLLWKWDVNCFLLTQCGVGNITKQYSIAFQIRYILIPKLQNPRMISKIWHFYKEKKNSLINKHRH